MKKMNLDVVHIYIFVFFKLDEWLQSYDLKCINIYNLDVGCTLATFLSFPTFSNHFRPMWLKITHNCKFGKNVTLIDSKWPNLVILYDFCIFSPKNEAGIDSELSISPDSQLFPSFATKASHFWRNLKNFNFWGGGTSANFLSFPTFSNHFTPMWLKITHNCKFGLKSGLD